MKIYNDKELKEKYIPIIKYISNRFGFHENLIISTLRPEQIVLIRFAIMQTLNYYEKLRVCGLRIIFSLDTHLINHTKVLYGLNYSESYNPKFSMIYLHVRKYYLEYTSKNLHETRIEVSEKNYKTWYKLDLRHRNILSSQKAKKYRTGK